jgi:hypothetical protein
MLDNNVKYIYDKPVDYKGIKIYPVTMEDFFEFNYAMESLLIDKDSIPDTTVISMTYYEFLIYVGSQMDEKNFLNNPQYKLDLLLRICLHLDRDPKESPITYGYDGKKAAFQINEKTYYSKDLDAIKDIIIKQNSIETFNPNIRKETRELLQKARNLKAKMNGDKQCDLEEQMICLSIATTWPLEEIYKMTLRKFKKYIRRIDHKLHYEIYKTATMSGFVEFKDKNFPKHWMVDLDKEDKYEDVLVDFDSVSDKISNKIK